PQLAWWLLAAFVAVVLVRWRGRRQFVAATTLRWIDRSSRASIFRRLPFLTLVTALALTACALMDPVLPYSESQIQSRGLDIDLVDDQILRGEGMTAIGDGLALANFLLSRQAVPGVHRNPVIVLFTDGENNRGRDPLEVLKEVDDAAVRVHMVGVDLEEEVR